MFGDLVMAMEHSQEMGGIIMVGVTHGKVINNQGEVDVAGVMFPEARIKGVWVVAMREQELLDLVISNLTSLWQAYMPHWIST